MTTPILLIVGRSNSGKTTLLEALIATLQQQGMRIATIKHSHHEPEMDTPGKDSWRHKQAGAVASLLVAPTRLMMVSDISTPLTPQYLAKHHLPSVDLILVEGYAGMEGAKIEVVRSERATTLRHADDKNLIAVATDVVGLISSTPIFGLNDTPSLALFIKRWMLQHD
ncbi:MAG: molybdopterin-guanine dinucleotide biosynthesis protein B [Mariprofundaceae bacterium]|nr:molybdopterin-guanine dinucleotide biosynthesis protein B [Mariprofundaceae bacterium]